ncbi:hypothetical protein GBF35_42940 [Nonomuraea phyllanthi]|uniref:hypothetical protein n=1 Tax=Nonomuraea phyllanthi TaxID=2219224 RepID=UPI001293F899|nr:hypothetical protein [Nonomuraea phyllanthi]QFY12440.1 hypothetical protein GBF35_42940 [Nonomuraea phyllanthi]
MILRTVAVAVAVLMVSSSPALANPLVSSWGPIYSADRAGKAKGKVVRDRPGSVVNGKLYDFPGREGCSWLTFRWVTDKGVKKHKTYHNCSGTKPLAFSLKVGYVVSIDGRLCRGTGAKATGRCSTWKKVGAQGG